VCAGTKDARDTSRHRDDKKRANLARVSATGAGEAPPPRRRPGARVGNASVVRVPAFPSVGLIKDAVLARFPHSARAELRRSPARRRRSGAFRRELLVASR
jgi:hypothetical protein